MFYGIEEFSDGGKAVLQISGVADLRGVKHSQVEGFEGAVDATGKQRAAVW